MPGLFCTPNKMMQICIARIVWTTEKVDKELTRMEKLNINLNLNKLF